MPTYIVFANTDDGFLTSASASYASAVAGTGLVLDNSSNNITIGQDLTIGTYHIYEAFLNFDTSSIPTAEKCIEAMLKLTLLTDTGVINLNDIDVRLLTWASPLTTGQWKNPNTVVLPAPQFGAQYGQYIYQQIPVQLSTGLNHPAEMINKGGATRFVVGTADALLAIPPTAAEYLTANSSNIGTSADPTLVVYTVKRDTMRIVNKCQSQLSTGEIVAIVSDGADPTPALTLGYYTKGSTTFNTIASLPVGTAINQLDAKGGNNTLDLVIDPSDNIYVVGIAGINRTSWWLQAFSKISGLHWTAQTIGTQPSATGQLLQEIAATFITNTTNAGYLWVVGFPEITTWMNPANNLALDGSYAVFIASALLSSTQPYISSAQSLLYFQFAPSYPFDGLIRCIDTAPFSVARVDNSNIITAYASKQASTAAMQIAWCVLPFNAQGGGNGSLFTGQLGLSSSATNTALGPDSKIKIVTLDGHKVAILFGEGPGRHSVILVDSSANGITYGAINFSTMPDFSTSSDWDAAYDPASGNIWLYYIDATSNRRIAKVSFNINSLNWATSETQVTTTLGSAGGTNSKLRVANGITNGLNLLIEAASVTSGGVWSTSAVADSFNNAPNAPTINYIAPFDATAAKTITWNFSDPDSNDTQLAYAIEIDNNGTGASAYRSGTVTGAPGLLSTITLGANALSNNITYRIRISTKDSNNTQGPFSGYTVFSTSSVGSLTITDPATDNPANQIVANYLVKWTYTNSGSATQTKYQIKMIRLSDGVQLYDSGLVSSTTAQATVPNIPSATPVRFDLVITNSLSQTTATSSRLFTTNWGAPDQITILNANSGKTSVVLTWTIPTPTGSRPAASTYDVFRSVDGGITWTQIINLPTGTNGYTDNVVPSGVTPMYVIRSNAVNGYQWSVQATATAPISFLGILISEQINTTFQKWSAAQAMFFGGASNVETISVGATQLQFAGRALPVTEFGENGTDSISVQATLPFYGNPSQSIDDTNTMTDVQVKAVLEALVLSRVTICFRDGRGRQVFGTISQLTENDDDIGTKVSFQVDAVDYQEGSVVTNVTT